MACVWDNYQLYQYKIKVTKCRVTKEASVQAEHENESFYQNQKPTVTGFEFR